MTEPVSILPFVNRDVVIVKPAFVVGVIELVAEGNERLLARVGKVERKHSTRAKSFGFKTQKARGRAHVEHRLAGHLDAAGVILKAPARIPMAFLHTEARQ